MRNALKAGGTYFAIVFAAGFLLGTIRMLLIAPAIGELAAVLGELPIILAIAWFACGWAIGRFTVAPAFPVRLTMGVIALVLLLVAEILLSVLLAGGSIAEHFALYQTLPALVGFIGQIGFALFPLLQHRLANPKENA